ncbi:hypothetical protein KTR10_01985 [Candidatus Kaiserbacteria bacterium]|nr:hypothetical protein [Candidatus Kaiserbacteria bacterium]
MSKQKKPCSLTEAQNLAIYHAVKAGFSSDGVAEIGAPEQIGNERVRVVIKYSGLDANTRRYVTIRKVFMVLYKEHLGYPFVPYEFESVAYDFMNHDVVSFAYMRKGMRRWYERQYNEWDNAHIREHVLDQDETPCFEFLMER